MNMEMPAYSTRQSEALLPVFVSSLVFNGIIYTGKAGRSKKEAEQLAARAVIRAFLVTSGSTTVLSEIINSNVKLYAALNKAKESNYSTQNIANSCVPTAAISDSITGMHLTAAIPDSSTGMHLTAAIPDSSTGIHPTVAIPDSSTGMHPTAGIPKESARMHQMAVIPEASAVMQLITVITDATVITEATTGVHPTAAAPETSTGSYLPDHEFKMPKTEPSSETVALPISFVPPVLGQPSGVGPSSSNKQRKNKTKANKKLSTDGLVRPCAAAQPLTKVPPCSVAQ